jgi:hypothetical protein
MATTITSHTILGAMPVLSGIMLEVQFLDGESISHQLRLSGLPLKENGVFPSPQEVDAWVVSRYPYVAAQLDFMQGTASEALSDFRTALNLPAPPAPPEPSPVPASVSPAQARLALLDANLLDGVEQMVEQLPREAQIRWEMATEVRRDDPLVLQMATALELDSEALDNLFVLAATK